MPISTIGAGQEPLSKYGAHCPQNYREHDILEDRHTILLYSHTIICNRYDTVYTMMIAKASQEKKNTHRVRTDKFQKRGQG